MLPDAIQVADPYHVVALANRAWMSAGDGCRTRRSVIAAARIDPLYRARRRLVMARNG